MITHTDSQTEIVIGTNKIKSFAMTLLGKRCFLKSQYIGDDKYDDSREVDVD